MNIKEDGYLYYLKLNIEGKIYYKIGFTKGGSIYKRFSFDESDDYKYIENVLLFHYFENALELEQNIHNFLKKKLRKKFTPPNKYPFFKNGQSEIYPEDVLYLDNYALNEDDKTRRDNFLKSWTEAVEFYSDYIVRAPVYTVPNRPIYNLLKRFQRKIFGDPLVKEKARILNIDPDYYQHRISYLNSINLIYNCHPFRDYDINIDPIDWLGYAYKNQKDKNIEARGYPYKKQSIKWYENLWDWANELNIPEKTIPRNLEDLISLEELDLLIINGGSGPFYINRHIGRLKNLKRLEIWGIGGVINFPTEICNLKNLVELSIISGKFYTLPESFGDLTNLEKLDLSSGELRVLPNSIGDLKNLKILELGDNNLKTLPPSIGNLSKLEELGLGGRTLTGGTLSKRNDIKFFPDELEKLSKLKRLEIGSGAYDIINKTKIGMPKVICRLKNLEFLHSDLLIDDCISEIYKMKKLRDLTGRFDQVEKMKIAFKKLKRIPTIIFYTKDGFILKK